MIYFLQNNIFYIVVLLYFFVKFKSWIYIIFVVFFWGLLGELVYLVTKKRKQNKSMRQSSSTKWRILRATYRFLRNRNELRISGKRSIN